MRRLAFFFITTLTLSIPLAGGCGGDETQTTGTGGTSGTGGMSGTGGTGGMSGTGGMGTGGSGGSIIVPGQYDCSPPTGVVPPLQLTEIATGLAAPVLVKSAPGDDTRLFVLEQPGRIRIIENGTLLPDPFLDLTSKVQYQGERGLLGLAFHPDYLNNGRFFVYYSSNNGGEQTIEEYKATGNMADPMPVAQLFAYPDSQANHNGGSIEFSPKDGYLYISWGDEGGAGDQHGTIGNAQDLSVLHGKILRVDIDDPTQKPYGIPPGNMSAIPPGNLTMGPLQPEIWDYGLRNAWRVSFDICTGDLYMGDVGQGAWEEVDVEPAGEGQKNYGWRVLEGTHCYNPPSNCPTDGMTMPVAEYDHNEGKSISGGYVYRGSAIPALRGTYFYGDYVSGKIWSFVFSNGMATALEDRTADLQSSNVRISSFGQDDHGEIYVVDHGGTIFRIDPE